MFGQEADPRPGETMAPAETAPPPRYDDLAAIFRPIFATIAAGAVARERDGKLAYAEVDALRAAGFGRVRIPRSAGGMGATIPQLFGLLIELAEADSNVSHLFRGHFAFLEARLNDPDPATRHFWFPKVVAGALIGYAMAERNEATAVTARLFSENGEWFVDGVKYYSTGTIYADWIVVSLVDGASPVSVGIPVDTPGVERIDDWDGFGQRFTGSGTTKFNRVKIPEQYILRRFVAADLAVNSYQKGFLQLLLLVSIAGIGKAVLRDAVAFVQPRTRSFGILGQSSPRQDPLVQRVVGRIASLSFAAESMIEAVAAAFEDLNQAARAGAAEKAQFMAADMKAFQAQQMVIDLVLQAATLLFEVGGASATSKTRQLDRHWRNARTLASHNPATYRERAIGDYYLNGAMPDNPWKDVLQKAEAGKAGDAGETDGADPGKR